jgi:uncharacterized membrane protein (DUF2068 family)
MAIGAGRTFDERARQPPGTWRKVFYVVLAIALPAAVWAQRGAVVGVVALAVYAGIFLMGAFGHDALLGWSARHVALDALLIVPLAFLALALCTGWPVGLCVLIAVAAGAVLVPVAARRRGGRRARGR